MKSREFIVENAAATALADRLPQLPDQKYKTIDRAMKVIARDHDISADELHRVFVAQYKATPDHWIKRKLKKSDKIKESTLDELSTDGLENNSFEHNELMDEFIRWSCERLHISQPPQFEWSYDTKDAQDNHHTGRHVRGSNTCWVYVKNRNLVDIMRTVFHELVHIRQDELGMIGDNASYPGSPIEAMADVLAGKYIKIFGEQHHEIFQ